MTVIVTKGNRLGAHFEQRFVERQAPPYISPLPYKAYGGDVSVVRPYSDRQTYPDQLNWVPGPNEGQVGSYGRIEAQNKALDKLAEWANESADLLVAWKERQSALDLVYTKVGQLVRTARAIKKRDPKIVRRIMKRKPKGADVPGTPASLWLEYHFAILPTISDIHHALGIFSHQIAPVVSVTASGHSFQDWSSRGYFDYYDKLDYTSDQKHLVKLGGRLVAIDPNVVLAQSFGFGQPLSVAYEMTPFSWFIDYFVNVGQLLSNLEPKLSGFKFEDQYMSHLVSMETYYESASYSVHSPEPYFLGPKWSATSYYMTRSLGWPKYELQVNSPFALSGQRVSYITAVLVGMLKGFIK